MAKRVIHEVFKVSFAEVNPRIKELTAAGHLASAMKLEDGLWQISVTHNGRVPSAPKRVAEWHHERDRNNLRGANASGFLPCKTRAEADAIAAKLIGRGALRASVVKGGVSFCF